MAWAADLCSAGDAVSMASTAFVASGSFTRGDTHASVPCCHPHPTIDNRACERTSTPSWRPQRCARTGPPLVLCASMTERACLYTGRAPRRRQFGRAGGKGSAGGTNCRHNGRDQTEAERPLVHQMREERGRGRARRGRGEGGGGAASSSGQQLFGLELAKAAAGVDVIEHTCSASSTRSAALRAAIFTASVSSPCSAAKVALAAMAGWLVPSRRAFALVSTNAPNVNALLAPSSSKPNVENRPN